MRRRAPALTAIQARNQLALLTIVDVRQHPGGTAVRVRTPLYLRDLPGASNREVSVFFPCGDRRLLEVGRRWIGAIMGTEPFYGSTTPGAQLDE